jgi:hypothetical protein
VRSPCVRIVDNSQVKLGGLEIAPEHVEIEVDLYVAHRVFRSTNTGQVVVFFVKAWTWSIDRPNLTCR